MFFGEEDGTSAGNGAQNMDLSAAEMMAEVRKHVQWLLDNNQDTIEAGTAQFNYVSSIPRVELIMIIAGLLGTISNLNERLDES